MISGVIPQSRTRRRVGSVLPLTAPDSSSVGTAPETREDGFFTGKNDTLLQSLVEGAIKSVFSGIIVAAVSLCLLGIVRDEIALAKKREALDDFVNASIATAIAEVNSAYTVVPCTRDTTFLGETECRNGLGSLAGVLRKHGALLGALLEKADLKSIDRVISLVDQLRRLQSDSTDADETATKLSTSYADMIASIAQHYR